MDTATDHEKKLSDEYFTILGVVENRFKNGELQEAVKLALDSLLKNTVFMRESAFREYQLTASKGFSFKEREKLINWKKVRWCDEEIKRLSLLKKNHRVIPFSEWFTVPDYNLIRSVGLRKFVHFNLAQICE